MAFIARYWFFSHLTDTDALILGASFGIISQLGDFSESLLKRSAGVKFKFSDSSTRRDAGQGRQPAFYSASSLLLYKFY